MTFQFGCDVKYWSGDRIVVGAHYISVFRSAPLQWASCLPPFEGSKTWFWYRRHQKKSYANFKVLISSSNFGVIN
jgi:hypothetical protein